MGVLTVTLNKILNLADADTIGKSDPFVRFQVEEDNWVMDKNMGKHCSTVKKDDCNPVYDETFTWELPSLDKMVLFVKVVDDDPIKNDKLGSCKIKLSDLNLSASPTGTDRVIDNNLFSKDARIYLQLTWTE